MKKFRYNLILLALIIFFALPVTSFAQQDPQDPWLADTVLFEGMCYYLEGSPYSGKIRVPVIFFNDEELKGISVPLIWSGSVILDSASYAGSRVEEIEYKVVEIDSLNNKLLLAVAVFEDTFVPPGRGLFNTLYFTISDTGYLEIDKTFFPPGNVLTFSGHSHGWTPQFIKLQFEIVAYSLMPGDVNQDAGVDIVDVVFLINYLFRSGQPPPCSTDCADVNCDCEIDITDVIYLINYLFKRGDRPYTGCPSAL